MVSHIVMWSFREEMTAEEKTEAAKKMKEGLEGLMGKIPGMLSCQVYIDVLPSSTHDLVLTSTFESEEALKGYQTHPEHMKVKTYVHTVVSKRPCMDFPL